MLSWTAERLATIGSAHSIAIRFHRTCRWMNEAEQLDPVRHTDQISDAPLAIYDQIKRCKPRGRSRRCSPFMSGGW